MKIEVNMQEGYITYTPSSRTLMRKINSFLKLGNMKLHFDSWESVYEIWDFKKKKSRISYISKFLKKIKYREIIFIYKWGTSETGVYGYTNKKGKKKRRSGFSYTSEYFSNLTTEKPTTYSIIKYCSTYLLENFHKFQVELSDESEPKPLYSITIKFA